MLKHNLKLIAAILAIITLVSVFCYAVKATEDAEPTLTTTESTNEENSENPQVISPNPSETTTEKKEDEIIKKDLYVFEESATMDKIVDGNVYIFGNNVKITGKVNGNVFVFGSDVNFTSPYPADDTEHQQDNYCYIAGSVYGFGQNIKFDAVANDVYAFGNKFEMSYNSYIMRDVYLAFQDVELKGYITRNANIAADKIDFGKAPEDENAEKELAFIGGDLNYTASSKIEIPEGVVIGETNYNEAKSNTSEEFVQKGKSITDYLFNLVRVLIYTLAMYLIINWLSPKFFEKSAEILKTSTGSSFGFGFLGLVVVPVISLILLLLSLVSLSVTAITVYSLILAFTFTIISGSLTYILKDKVGFDDKKVLLLVIVTIILWALKQIPVLGGLITLAISTFGLGVVIKNVLNSHKEVEENK